MADVFVSYARADLAFVRDLHGRLVADGRGVWVDFEGIPPSAAWWQEIQEAIDAAQAVVFVLSPAWMASEVSGRELEHADTAGKRIVPVVLESVPDAEVPRPLADRNWIFFRPTDDHDAAFAQLREALDTDLDWVHDHTRLLVRAVEWVDKGRDPSFLLRGRDLDAAEQWLRGAADREPAPTAQQIDYLIAGRQAATRAGHRRLAGVGLALVVAVSLAVVALVQRNRAEHQTELARSQALAASADAELDDDPELSTLLAAEAYRRSPSDESVRVLRDALSRSNVDAHLVPEGDRGISSVDVSDDGATAMTVSSDDDGFYVELWDVDTGERSDLRPPDFPVTEAIFATDELGLAVASEGVVTWSLETGERVEELVADQGFVWSLAVSPDHRYLALGYAGGRVALHDLATGTRIRTLPAPDADARTVDFDASSTRLAGGFADGSVIVWAVPTGEEVSRRVLPGGALLSVDLGLGGGIVSACTESEAPTAWFVDDGNPLGGLEALTEPCSSMEAAPVEPRFVISSTDGRSEVWDVASREVVQTLTTAPGVVRSTFLPDGRSVVSAELSFGGDATVWALNDRAELGLPYLVGQYLDSGHGLVGVRPDGEVVRADAATGEVTDRFAGSGQAVDARAGGDDQLQVVEGAVDHQHLVAVDLDAGRTEEETALGAGGVEGLAVGGDDARVAIAMGGRGIFLSDRSTALTGSHGGDRYAADVDLSADGNLLAAAERVGNGDAHVTLWDPDAGERTRDLGSGGTWVNAVVISPDGHRVAAATTDAGIVVWSVDGDEVLRIPTGDTLDLTWSADGSLLASGEEAGTATVWDARTGERLTRFVAEPSGYHVDFAPEGDDLLVIGYATRVYDCSLCVPDDELLDLVDERTGRELTAEERERFHVDG